MCLSEGHIRVFNFALYVIDVAFKTLVPSSASHHWSHISARVPNRLRIRYEDFLLVLFGHLYLNDVCFGEN